MNSMLPFPPLCANKCTVESVQNKTFVIKNVNDCYKIETFPGGEFQAGSVNWRYPCTMSSHKTGRKFSELDAENTVLTESVIHYKKWNDLQYRWTGAIEFEEVMGSTEPFFLELEKIAEINTERKFDGLVSVPSCDYGCATLNDTIISLDLIQDDYPGETSWYIKNECTGETIRTGGAYGLRLCVDKHAKYSFTIEDSQGDGICCRWGEGSYNLIYGEEEIKIGGGEFGSSETVTFGDESSCT